jgi:DNA-binding NarL/FixJ family response regulator
MGKTVNTLLDRQAFQPQIMENIRLILIEDRNLTRICLRAALQRYREFKLVAEASSAKQGWQVLTNIPADVAIINIGLPDLNGVELTQLFCEFQREKLDWETKILILSGDDSEDSVLAAFAAGADSYCLKQTNIEQLAEAVNATHAGRLWLDPAITPIILGQLRTALAADSSSETENIVQISGLEPELHQIIENYPLTERELEILQLIVAGKSNAEISEQLYITLGTVKTHVRNILNKLSVSDRTQAAVRALRAGLVS